MFIIYFALSFISAPAILAKFQVVQKQKSLHQDKTPVKSSSINNLMTSVHGYVPPE
jgi:hypothetical protein